MSQTRVAVITSRVELGFWLNNWASHPLPEVDIVSVISHNAFMPSTLLPVRILNDADFNSIESFESALLEEWMPRRVDFVVAWEFDKLFSPRVLEVFPHKVLDVYPSIVPPFKGLPENRYKEILQSKPIESGATLHEIDTGIDSGKIISQKKFPLESNESLFSLQEKTRKAGMELLLDYFLKKGELT